MSVLFIPEGELRGFTISTDIANGQTLRFQFADVDENYIVSSSTVSVIIPANQATLDNSGAPWTLKHGLTTVENGVVYVEPAPVEGGGAQGPPGADGADGTDGVDGINGSKWFSGTVVPSNGTGVIGDWYINTANGNLYEKTGSTTWTLRVNIKGADGAAGAAGADGANGVGGTKWLQAAGAPGGGTGLVGDWYINVTTYDVYEKTGVSTWTSRGNIKGATGTAGSAGSAGAAGTNGAKWLQAAGAPAGGTGVVGDWYINTTNFDIYEKTGVSTWTARGNIKGATGTNGADGAAGANGTNGTNGQGVLFLGTGAPVPPGTPAGTLIIRPA